MALKAGWMPTLLQQIDWGCATSRLISGILTGVENDQALFRGRQLCINLWPFIKELPENIRLVRDALPESMEAAKKLLSQLADDERYYQKLYIKQCELSGLTEDDLNSADIDETAKPIRDVMRKYCRSGDYRDGILAVVTAELAATAFSRTALPVYERYFAENNDRFGKQKVEDGLEWLRIHAKPQTRNALWLIRMLSDITNQEDGVPVPVADMLSALFSVWNCPKSDTIPSHGLVAERVH
ncbi:MAG TPA: hypothetical protein V6D17_23740 [Candidatus Obscuribacterales bacterium]